MLQITNCNGSTSYNITGLQSNTQYSIGVTVCTVAGEGPILAVTGRTLSGIPSLVKNINATMSSSNSITFGWNPVDFDDDMGGTYEVS